jgi:anti-sigma factor RsiW
MKNEPEKMSHTGPDDRYLLVHAYCDGELDPVNAKSVHLQISADPRLSAERDRIMALRRALQNKLPAPSAPSGLRSRVERAVGLATRRVGPSWNAIAASIAAAVIISASAWYFSGRSENSIFMRELTASHARALIAARVTDVDSSDQHTIKPWFSTRTAQAPRIVDLASEEFPIVGGRLDVIEKIPVPTIVYSHRGHFISLTQIPGTAATGIAVGLRSVDGFHVVGWSEGDTSYWATSDIGIADLEKFVRKFRAAAP